MINVKHGASTRKIDVRVIYAGIKTKLDTLLLFTLNNIKVK